MLSDQHKRKCVDWSRVNFCADTKRTRKNFLTLLLLETIIFSRPLKILRRDTHERGNRNSGEQVFPEEWYDEGIKKLVVRLQKFIEQNGNYVKKQRKRIWLSKSVICFANKLHLL